jgi:hypothetical protein
MIRTIRFLKKQLFNVRRNTNTHVDERHVYIEVL